MAFSGIDASSGLAGQVAIGRARPQRLIACALLAALVPYVGIALVASARCLTAARRPDDWVEAPMLGVAAAFDAGVAARAAALPGRGLGAS